MAEIKVAYLGPQGTFTEKVARDFFPSEDLVPLQPIRKVVKAVETGEAEHGIVPIENFYNGEVRETLDSLTECSRTRIIAETSLAIVHCLGALQSHGQVTRIYSKDQALEQCSRYLCEKYPDADTIAVSSTALAAERVAREKMLDAAAIASESALKAAGLEILASDICPNNKTRFAVLWTASTNRSGDDKTFIAIHPQHPRVRDKPGVLDCALGFFARLGINLEYIQSRPDGKRGYIFYIELNGHERDEAVVSALDSIRLSLDQQKMFPNTVKVLGSYKNTHWKEEK